jgi:hypothetical protein
MKKIIIIAVTALISQVAIADSLVATSAKAKGSNVIALDVLTDGASVGFQINIPAKGSKVDFSGLTKTVGKYEVSKNYNGQEVVITFANDDNSPIAKGRLNLGSIRVVGGEVGQPTFIAADAQAKAVSSEVSSN